MLDTDIADIPEDKRHWPSWLGDFLLHVVPGIPVSVYSTGSVAIDMDTLSSNHEACMVVLESNWV